MAKLKVFLDFVFVIGKKWDKIISSIRERFFSLIIKHNIGKSKNSRIILHRVINDRLPTIIYINDSSHNKRKNY